MAQSAAADTAGAGLSAVKAGIAFVAGNAFVAAAYVATRGVDVKADLLVLFEEAVPAYPALVVAFAIGKHPLREATGSYRDAFSIAAFLTE